MKFAYLDSLIKVGHKFLHKICNMEMQYGFRPGWSCEHALLNAQSTLLESLNRSQVSLLLLIDFSKAFDMVAPILLIKLYHSGIRGAAVKWVESYLWDHKQFVSVSEATSLTLHMKFGVPKCSILGPLLFIIFVYNIPEIDSLAKFILYCQWR